MGGGRKRTALPGDTHDWRAFRQGNMRLIHSGPTEEK
jgi:hypothetical protein